MSSFLLLLLSTSTPRASVTGAALLQLALRPFCISLSHSCFLPPSVQVSAGESQRRAPCQAAHTHARTHTLAQARQLYNLDINEERNLKVEDSFVCLVFHLAVSQRCADGSWQAGIRGQPRDQHCKCFRRRSAIRSRAPEMEDSELRRKKKNVQFAKTVVALRANTDIINSPGMYA